MLTKNNSRYFIKSYPETMVAESVDAKIFKIGSVVFRVMTILTYNYMECFCQNN